MPPLKRLIWGDVLENIESKNKDGLACVCREGMEILQSMALFYFVIVIPSPDKSVRIGFFKVLGHISADKLHDREP